MSAEFAWGMICGLIGARVERWKVWPRGGGLLASLLVATIGISSHIGIRGLIRIGLGCFIALELLYRSRQYRIHRCVACKEIIWPWQNRATVLSSSVIAEGCYHNSVKRACLKWPKS